MVNNQKLSQVLIFKSRTSEISCNLTIIVAIYTLCPNHLEDCCIFCQILIYVVHKIFLKPLRSNIVRLTTQRLCLRYFVASLARLANLPKQIGNLTRLTRYLVNKLMVCWKLGLSPPSLSTFKSRIRIFEYSGKAVAVSSHRWENVEYQCRPKNFPKYWF
jgi:hypothetical protein